MGGNRPGGRAVKTPPFHGVNRGSVAVRVTTKNSDAFASEVFDMHRLRESNDLMQLSGGQLQVTSSKAGDLQYCNDSRTGHPRTSVGDSIDLRTRSG